MKCVLCHKPDFATLDQNGALEFCEAHQNEINYGQDFEGYADLAWLKAQWDPNYTGHKYFKGICDKEEL